MSAIYRCLRGRTQGLSPGYQVMWPARLDTKSRLGSEPAPFGRPPRRSSAPNSTTRPVCRSRATGAGGRWTSTGPTCASGSLRTGRGTSSAGTAQAGVAVPPSSDWRYRDVLLVRTCQKTLRCHPDGVRPGDGLHDERDHLPRAGAGDLLGGGRGGGGEDAGPLASGRQGN